MLFPIAYALLFTSAHLCCNLCCSLYEVVSDKLDTLQYFWFKSDMFTPLGSVITWNDTVLLLKWTFVLSSLLICFSGVCERRQQHPRAWVLTFPTSPHIPCHGEVTQSSSVLQSSLGVWPKAVLRPRAADTHFLPRMRDEVQSVQRNTRAVGRHTRTPSTP